MLFRDADNDHLVNRANSKTTDRPIYHLRYGAGNAQFHHHQTLTICLF